MAVPEAEHLVIPTASLYLQHLERPLKIVLVAVTDMATMVEVVGETVIGLLAVAAAQEALAVRRPPLRAKQEMAVREL
jgi:hypothetical protein